MGGLRGKLPLPCAGLFIYGYSCYYYFARSDMSGFMQTSCAPTPPDLGTHHMRSPSCD